MLRKQLLDTSRGRIVTLLQSAALTVDDLASKLMLTPNAVRAQITAMERDGVVRRVAVVRETTRPLTCRADPEVEQLFREYVPRLRTGRGFAAPAGGSVERCCAAGEAAENWLRETPSWLRSASQRRATL